MAQHISVRVPWKDNGYTGRVCDKPCYNIACLRLKNIANSRNDSLEESLHGYPILGHEKEIPCLSEGGCFMSSDTYTKTTVHPYKKGNSGTHGHFLETDLIYPPFSLPARPFAWTMLSRNTGSGERTIQDLACKFGIDYREDREPELSFRTNWVQDAGNQREIFRVFYQDVVPNKSIVIPYAKQVPFIDDNNRRVVMGIGYITSITEPPEHNHTNESELRSILWETMLGHSIRDDRKNGFLLPYREMMQYAKKHPDFDMHSITVFAEDDYFEEYSYATEHLSYDAVISVLLQTINALEIIKNCIPGNWGECLRWTKARLKEVWLDRGPFPGLGSMLTAVGFRCGEVMARELKAHVSDMSEYENVLAKAIDSPKKYFSPLVLRSLGRTEVNTFKTLPQERRTLFWLIARMALTEEQACIVFHSELRKKCGIDCSDKEIIKNPYILHEQTRICENVYIPLKKVDMAVFPPDEILSANPVPAPSALDSKNDKRRIRAYMVGLLEMQALWGHTVYPLENMINEINGLPIDPPCHVTGDIVNSIADFLLDELVPIDCKNGGKAYQLKRLHEFDEVIRSSVQKRLNGARHVVNEDWRAIVDRGFGGSQATEFEERARTEKAAILKELAESRLSVLIGGAGTGKTTLLALLCKSPQIRDGGVLLLAPTGKARVRMSQAMKAQGVDSTAKTVAQFLSESGRFNGYTMEYLLSDVDAKNVPYTVIIDESSMLTEEMFGALLQALKKNAKRIIFVGDPNQLPPIGAGRPFVDLVRKLNQNINKFPRTGLGFGQLTVTMRQLSDDGNPRGDTELSKWYMDDSENLDDSIFIKLQSGSLGKHVTFKSWDTPEKLEQLIYETIAEETDMTGPDDIQGFNLSIGGYINGEWMNFAGSEDDIRKIESWQILSAYRNDTAIGTATINRYLHEKYRSQKSLSLPGCRVRGTRNLLGTDGIVYGDKVINVRNHKHHSYNAKQRVKEEGYVANGEVGIVERIWEKPKSQANTHQIIFSSQPSVSYNWPSSVPEEGSSDLELAYALTVHKAQGSEFGKVILVLGEPGDMLSKELLYTAITRQKDKLVILYNDGAYRLRDYASTTCSEVAKRFTCLFELPDIIEFKKKYYEQALIHKTMRGELVRSKSEVIIANMLFQSGIDYEYEKELDLGEDGIRIPDFTIEDSESGILFYWEHCGMLGDAGYNRHWQEKKAVYEKHGITEGKNLIVSEDSMNGGIDSAAIKKLIDTFLK